MGWGCATGINGSPRRVHTPRRGQLGFPLSCAVVLFQQSTFLIGAEGASILSTLEPITSVIIGVAVFREPFGIRLLGGTILVLLASVITVCFSLMKKSKKA